MLGLARRVDFDYQKARTVIDGRVLHATWSDLAGIDLHALTGDLFLIAFDLAPPAFALQTADAESAVTARRRSAVVAADRWNP